MRANVDRSEFKAAIVKARLRSAFVYSRGYTCRARLHLSWGRDRDTSHKLSIFISGKRRGLSECNKELTWFRLAVPEQHGVHVHEEDHAAEVEVEVESLVERRRYVRGYYFRHGKGDPHHDQKFPVQRAQSGRQGVAAAETEIEAEWNADPRAERGLNPRSRK